MLYGISDLDKPCCMCLDETNSIMRPYTCGCIFHIHVECSRNIQKCVYCHIPFNKDTVIRVINSTLVKLITEIPHRLVNSYFYNAADIQFIMEIHSSRIVYILGKLEDVARNMISVTYDDVCDVSNFEKKMNEFHDKFSTQLVFIGTSSDIIDANMATRRFIEHPESVNELFMLKQPLRW